MISFRYYTTEELFVIAQIRSLTDSKNRAAQPEYYVLSASCTETISKMLTLTWFLQVSSTCARMLYWFMVEYLFWK